MRAGDTIESFRAGIPQSLLASMGGVVDPGMLAAKTAFRGNCLPIKMVPMGTQVYNVGSTTNKGAVFCRSAGTHATVIAKNEVGNTIRDVTVRLQSGEVRRVSAEACATIGVASNPHWQFRQLGKAGRSRLLNIRPTVRGLAMNAADHAHGGGRGKSKGNVNPVSIWGTPVCITLHFIRSKPVSLIMISYRPRVVTRLAKSATPTSTLCRRECATMASAGPPTNPRDCITGLVLLVPAKHATNDVHYQEILHVDVQLYFLGFPRLATALSPRTEYCHGSRHVSYRRVRRVWLGMSRAKLSFSTYDSNPNPMS
jgi:hypothetical protein